VNSLAGNVASYALSAGCLLLSANPIGAQENKTILGPGNVPLHDGAQALMAGDAEEGVRLTLLGLQQATNASERQTARANLCAGYALLEQYPVALAYCDAVLQENERNWRALSNRALIYIKLKRFAEADSDLLRGEAINPDAWTLQAVRRMYRDATDPVSPNIIIDERRGLPDDSGTDDDAD
jgi:tetratricopeptide (TPR) repeat protein